MREDMKGRIAIITGAAGGIGEAICRKLAEYEMKQVLVGRNVEKLERLASAVRAAGGDAVTCAGDIRDLRYLDEIVAAAFRAFGGIDVVINCAGLVHRCTVEEMTLELYEDVMATNVRAPYFLCQKALPALRASSCATIVNICSVVAHKGYPMQSVYAMSKHALLGFSKVLANEVFKDDIRVHAISPGAVFTPMIAEVRPDLTPEGMILPEDIANTVGYLLENRATAAVIDEICLHRSTKEPFA